MSNRRRRPSAPTAARAMAPTGRARVLVLAGAAALAVVIVGVVIALAGGTDDTTTSTDERPAFGPVAIDGPALDTFESTADDPAAGQPAPLVEGIAPDGGAERIPGGDEPTLVAFLAHWCPHCQREVPVLVDLMDAGELDGVRVVAVLTGTSPDRPNYPPVAWLEREGWSGDILLDDETSAAAAAYGLSSYPFLVFLDGAGDVVARTEGEVAADRIVALADQAR